MDFFSPSKSKHFKSSKYTGDTVIPKYYNILYQNVRGLRTKTTQFLSLLESSAADIFAITETGCNESICDSEISLPGYQILRCDRTDGRKHGGVLLVATPRFELRRLQVPGDIIVDSQQFELICASVYKHNRFLFVCCVLYIPPKANETEYMVMFNILEKFCIKYRSNIVILGDFNLVSCKSIVNSYFEYFVAFCEVTQCNMVPNCNNRQLDLVLSGRSGVLVCAAEEGLRPVDVYHPPLAVAVDVATQAQSSPVLHSAAADLAHAQDSQHLNPYKRWNFHKVDFNYLYYLIGRIHWEEMYSMQVPEEVLNFFYTKMNEVFDTCAPIKKQNNRNNRYNYPVWYTSDIIRYY
ncbi:hypothetical protein HF086_001091 [Spodoptera exigua]|uniref:Endonuclease/exonuclease/phosphatase domain-containing protein n=1 Tax=Spodoptera exigua TaxID=7107 RepID=A0A922SAL9_SPOEX|nr:hypothetical protein HF086_001091 [Spodoptera exigua]